MEFGKFETKPYIEAMKSEIEITYPPKIIDIIKARKVAARAQSGSSSGRVELQSITPEPALRPSTTSPLEVALESSSTPTKETTPSDITLGN